MKRDQTGRLVVFSQFTFHWSSEVKWIDEKTSDRLVSAKSSHPIIQPSSPPPRLDGVSPHLRQPGSIWI